MSAVNDRLGGETAADPHATAEHDRRRANSAIGVVLAHPSRISGTPCNHNEGTEIGAPPRAMALPPWFPPEGAKRPHNTPLAEEI